MKSKRICGSILCVALLLSAILAVLPTGADSDPTLSLYFEESFDDYEADVNGGATRLSDYFVVDANAIGDGYVKVEEDGKTGNLYLMSHVFTQVYTRESIKDPYQVSFTTYEMQGGFQSGMFFRAPMCGSIAYYEGDGGDPENGTSTGLSGIWLAVYTDRMVVTIKAYDADKPNKVVNHRFSFATPDGANYNDGIMVSILDDGTTASVLLNGELTCTLVFSEETSRGWSQNGIDRKIKLFQQITVLDAADAVQGTVEKTFVSAEESTIGWATRVANMKMDDILILVDEQSETEAPTEAPTEVPTETETEVPTETPTETEAEAPTETEAPTEVETTTEVPIEVPTEVPTESRTGNDTTAPDAPASTNAPTDTSDTADDSLAIYILIAAMLVAIGVTAGVMVTHKRKD